VGGHKAVPIDIRVIAATHRNLENMVQKNKFREDLGFRINVFSLILPPLRQRKEDTPTLAIHFISKKSREMGIKNLPAIAPGALERLRWYNWPGNVRELENTAERELILQREGLLTFDSLPHTSEALKKFSTSESGPDGAAALPHINPNTLRARINKLGIRYRRAQ